MQDISILLKPRSNSIYLDILPFNSRVRWFDTKPIVPHHVLHGPPLPLATHSDGRVGRPVADRPDVRRVGHRRGRGRQGEEDSWIPNTEKMYQIFFS